MAVWTSLRCLVETLDLIMTFLKYSYIHNAVVAVISPPIRKWQWNNSWDFNFCFLFIHVHLGLFGLLQTEKSCCCLNLRSSGSTQREREHSIKTIFVSHRESNNICGHSRIFFLPGSGPPYCWSVFCATWRDIFTQQRQLPQRTTRVRNCFKVCVCFLLLEMIFAWLLNKFFYFFFYFPISQRSPSQRYFTFISNHRVLKILVFVGRQKHAS